VAQSGFAIAALGSQLPRDQCGVSRISEGAPRTARPPAWQPRLRCGRPSISRNSDDPGRCRRLRTPVSRRCREWPTTVCKWRRPSVTKDQRRSPRGPSSIRGPSARRSMNAEGVGRPVARYGSGDGQAVQAEHPWPAQEPLFFPQRSPILDVGCMSSTTITNRGGTFMGANRILHRETSCRTSKQTIHSIPRRIAHS
jgi:hypothetical protein